MRSFALWRNRLLQNQWSEDAFNCSKCPRQGCPAWYDSFSIVNPDTAQLEELEGCQFMFNAAINTEQLHYTHEVSKSTQKQNQIIGAALKQLNPPKLPLLEGEVVDDVSS